LLDRARFPRDKACSEYLSPATTGVLERLGGGVLERVERAAHGRLFGMKLVAPSGVEAVGRFAGAHRYAPPRPYSFALPRTTFDLILRQAAEDAGAEVREGVTVEDLVWEGTAVAGVVARAGNPKGHGAQRATWRGRVVVGADGLRSVVARRLGVRRQSFLQRYAFSAHFSDVGGVTDVGEMHVGRQGYVGLGPIGDDVTTVALVVPRAALRGNPAPSLPRELDRFPGLAGRFAGARLVRPVLATGPFAQRSRRVAADGACLVGDAADFFDPFTGQGIYCALRTAELAAQSLTVALERDAPVRRAAFADYERSRRREFRGKWLLERLIAYGVGWPALAERVVARLARRPDLADLLVGATGNFVPTRAVFTPCVLTSLLQGT
jgi:flavin-dependent dehydrogenase